MSDDSGFEAFGIPLPIPPALAQAIARTRDEASMVATAEAARVETFLGGLDVDGLMALRAMLNTGDLAKSLTANFFDGQVVALLRYVHKVDAGTGRDPLADLPT